MATVAQLGARALRKLGIAIVADAGRPGAGPTSTAADVAARVLRELGIPVAEANRPASLGFASLGELIERTLRSLGTNLVGSVAAPTATVTQAQIATRALRAVGVDPADLGATSSGITYTHQEAGTLALRKLAVMASDEAPLASDQDYAEKRVLAVHDMLVSLDYATWGVDAIPGAVIESVVVMTANLIAPAFGKVGSPELAAAAQEMVRQQALVGTIAQTRALDRVASVHNALVAEGLADWDVGAIPDAVGEAYVTLTAALLAPVHGKQVEPQGAVAATAQVRRVVLSGPRGQALADAALRSVHDDAVSEGVVAWPLTAVPRGNAEEYVRMARVRLAPVFGVQASEDEYKASIENLKRQAFIAGAQQRAADRVSAVHEELNGMGLVTWGKDAIPASVADAYATMAAGMMQAEGGKPLDPAMYAANEARIRRIAMGGPAGQALAEQKVRAVHATLEARGRVRWTLFDIPVFAEEDYVLMAATLLAPECDVKADPNWWKAAEADLMRIVSLPSAREPVRAVYF